MGGWMVQASTPVLVGGLIDNLLETRSCRKWRSIIFFNLHSIRTLALVSDARIADRNIWANVALQFNRDCGHWLVSSSRQHEAYPNSQYKAKEMKHQNKNGLQSTIYLQLTENCQTYLIPWTWWIILLVVDRSTPRNERDVRACAVLFYYRATHTAHAVFCTGIATISRRAREGELTH